jgi:hypothetical protein
MNVQDLTHTQLAEQVDAFSSHSVGLLAENVDTYQQFDLCRKHKFG